MEAGIAASSRASSAGDGERPIDRLSGEVQLDPVRSAPRGERTAAGLEMRDLVGRDVGLFPEHVGRRQGGMPAKVDLGIRREPAELEPGLAVEPMREGRLREVHLGRDILHPSRVRRFGQDADRRGIAGEATIGERVDLGDALGHRKFLDR